MVSIGFVGVEAFDIILYMGRTLTKLHYPVLIIDLSNTGALTNSIYHGVGLDSADDIIHYRGLNYIRRIPKEDELDEFHNGIVFVVFGLNYVESLPLHLDVMNIVVNPFPHQIYKVEESLGNISMNDTNLRLLVRDIISLDDFERVKTSIVLDKKPVSTAYLYLDIIDKENALQCQLSKVVRFKRISSRMKKFIIYEIADICPNLKLSRIRRAALLARKGE